MNHNARSPFRSVIGLAVLGLGLVCLPAEADKSEKPQTISKPPVKLIYNQGKLMPSGDSIFIVPGDVVTVRVKDNASARFPLQRWQGTYSYVRERQDGKNKTRTTYKQRVVRDVTGVLGKEIKVSVALEGSGLPPVSLTDGSPQTFTALNPATLVIAGAVDRGSAPVDLPRPVPDARLSESPRLVWQTPDGQVWYTVEVMIVRRAKK